MKVGNIQATGAEICASASASANATALDIQAGNVERVGVQAKLTASASASAIGVKVRKGNSLEVGKEHSGKICDYSNEIIGCEFSFGEESVTGVKSGETAEVSTQAHGMDVQAGTAHITGEDTSTRVGATASASVCWLEVGNVKASGFEGSGMQTTADTALGVEEFNVNACSMSGRSGLGFTATPQVGNVNLALGAPTFNAGLNFNLGLPGGGGSSQGGAGRRNDGMGVMLGKVGMGGMLGVMLLILGKVAMVIVVLERVGMVVVFLGNVDAVRVMIAGPCLVVMRRETFLIPIVTS